MTRFDYLKEDLEICEIAKILLNFSKTEIKEDYNTEQWLLEEVTEEDLYIVE